MFDLVGRPGDQIRRRIERGQYDREPIWFSGYLEISNSQYEQKQTERTTIPQRIIQPGMRPRISCTSSLYMVCLGIFVSFNFLIPAILDQVVIAPLQMINSLCVPCSTLPFVQHDDGIRIFHGTQPVGYDNDRPAFKEIFHIIHNYLLVVGIQRVRGFVEENVFGFFIYVFFFLQPLFLSGAEPMSVDPDLGVVTQRQALHEVFDVGHFYRMFDPVAVGRLVDDPDVVFQRVGKDKPFLHHHAAAAPPAGIAVTVERNVVQGYSAGNGFVEAQQQFQQGRFAAAADPDDGRYLVRRDFQADVVQYLCGMGAFVLENYVLQFEVGIRGNLPDLFLVFGFFVFHVMDFIQAFRADLGVLRGLNETDELRNGAVQLSEDILHGHHHTEGHIPFDDRFGRDERNQHVFGLVDEQAADLLRLPEGHRLDADPEHLGLNPFPLPAFLFLAAVQLDLLHAVDQLHQTALVVGSLLETFVVQLLSLFQEYDDPSGVQGASQQENAQDRQVVSRHDRAVNDERKARKDDTQQRPHQKTLDTAVVSDPLHDVAHHFHVEKRNRQPHQFGQKIGNERDADPGGYVQRQPALDQTVRRLSERQGDLRDQDDDDKIQVAVVDPVIDDSLRQEREDQADHAAGQHGEEKLNDKFGIRPQIVYSISQPHNRFFVGIVLLLIKTGGRFDNQCCADRQVVFPGRQVEYQHFKKSSPLFSSPPADTATHVPVICQSFRVDRRFFLML